MAALLLLVCYARPAAAANCSASASTIAFGVYTEGNAANFTGTVTVTCTSGTSYKVGLNAGLNSPDGKQRDMYGGNGGQNTLNYSLYSDAGRTTYWGNTPGTNTVAGIGTGNAQTYTIYAQIPATDLGALGNYADTITVYITGSFTTATAQFSVNASVIAGCGISATAMNFGNYAGTVANSTSIVTISCTSGTTYNVGLNAGTATGATVTTRKMTGPSSATLSYALYSNSGLTINWGNIVGINTVAGAGTGHAQFLTVYGRIAAGQYLRPGSYSDTITASITY